METAHATSNRCRKKRKPFSDCTNTLDFTNPSQSSSSSTKNSTSLIKPTQILASNTAKPLNDDTSSNPSSLPANSTSSPSRTPKPSSAKGTVSTNAEASAPRSVYSRRQSADKRKGKRKAIDEPMSCFPALQTRITADETNDNRITSVSKSCELPNKKKRRRTTIKDDTQYTLPQDFIEQQRAYFAEIDAFELPEEEVDSIDELD